MARSWLLFALLAACRLHFDDRDGPADAGPDAETSLRIRVTGWGAVTGPGGIACMDDCSYSITGPITLAAIAGEAQNLTQFCGTDVTCNVQPGADVTATFVPRAIEANRVFVSSTLAVLDANGRNGLDQQCQARATAAGLTGTFFAFVSTAGQDAVDRLSGSRGWVRVDGLPVIDQRSDIGTDALPRGINLDETGAQVPLGFALTGSDDAGHYSVGFTCSDWTVVGTTAKGSRPDSAMHYLGGSTTQSSCTGYLYCFEVGKTVPVNLSPPAFPVGRYVFMSTPFGNTGGVAGADARCQADATAVGLPGTYQAVLATTTQSALDHVGSLAGAWRRPDGASVTRTGLDAGNFSTSFGISAAGTVVPTFAAFGAMSLTALGTMTCSDWTSTSVSQGITIGTFFMSPFNGVGFGACGPRPLVCVQTQ